MSERPSIAPVAESCDGLDNDCDGATDEALRQACYEGPVQTVDVGVCMAGMQTCQNAAWRACTARSFLTEEACNGRDDDCDGTTDENLTRACYGGPQQTAGVGECRRGRAACTGGSWGDCANATTPVNDMAMGETMTAMASPMRYSMGSVTPAVLVLALAESVVTCIAPMAKSIVMSVRVGPSRSCAMASTTTAMVKPMRPLIWSRAVSSALANVAVGALYVVRTGRDTLSRLARPTGHRGHYGRR